VGRFSSVHARTIRFEPHELGRPWEQVQVHVGDELVSWMQTVDVAHRLHGMELTSLGVVGVHTADAHQKQGHMRFMLESALCRAEDRRLMISTLYGEAPDLYHRWGYTTVMPEITTTIATGVAKLAMSSHTVRPAHEDDWPAMARVYNRSTSSVSGSRVRVPDQWPGPRQGTYFGRLKTWTLIVTDSRDRVVGYGTCDAELTPHSAASGETVQEVLVADAHADSLQVATSLVSAIAAVAVKRRVDEITFHLHPEGTVGRYLANQETTTNVVRPVGRAQMVRISDPNAVLTVLEPHIRQQAALLNPSRPERVAVRTEHGVGYLTLGGRGASRVVRLQTASLAEIIFGYRSATDLRAVHSVRLSRRDAEMLDVLFPPMDSYCCWPDRY
jgi:predicted acetyltransferase